MDIFDARNSGLVGGIGLILSALGLVVTGVGFAFTWLQLKRTKSAAEASSEAVRALKSRMSEYDTLADLAFAMSAAREIKRHIDGRQWKYALDGLEEIKIFLIRILELSGKTLEGEETQIKDTISKLSMSAQSLSKQIERGDVNNTQNIRVKIVDSHELLNRLSIKIKRSAK